jgi:hypothetical protein
MTRMTDNVLAFSQKTGTSELFAQFADLWNHYRVVNEGKRNLEFIKTKGDGTPISFEEKSSKLNDALKIEIAKIAGVQDFSMLPAEVWVTSPNYRWATFAVVGALVDMVLPDTIIDSVGLYTDVRTGGFGDNFSFDVEPNDLFYVTKAGRGKRHAEQQKSFNGQVIVTPVERDIAVAVNLYRVLAGKENLAAFAMKALRSMETEMAYDAWSAFDTAFAAVPTTTNKELKYSGWSQLNAIKLSDKVTNYNNGAKAIFVGTRAAVASILPSDSNYRIQIDSDYVKVGYVQNFFGIDILVLPQKANWKDPYQCMLNDDVIYCMSVGAQKPVKLCIEGSTLSIADEVYANSNLTQQTTMKKMWACGIASNSTYGEITISR